MAKDKSNRVVKANPLLAYFVEKESNFEGPRTHECTIFEDTFYFLHSSMNVDKVTNNEKDFKTDEEKVTAKYWALACDENGQRFCHTKEQLIDAVKASMGKRGFRDHCTKALIAMNELGDPALGNENLFGDDDSNVVDSDIDGTYDNEKKDSSSTEDAALQ